MIWKLLGWQKRLDALFDDGWVSLGLIDSRSGLPLNPVVVPTADSHV